MNIRRVGLSCYICTGREKREKRVWFKGDRQISMVIIHFRAQFVSNQSVVLSWGTNNLQSKGVDQREDLCKASGGREKKWPKKIDKKKQKGGEKGERRGEGKTKRR